MSKVEPIDAARVTKALTLLGSARRERLDKADYEAFVAGLSEFPVAIVERICREFGNIAPPEYGPRFPPLHTLREACHKAVEHERERRLALQAPVNTEDRIAPEKLANFRRDVEELIQRKAMP